VEQLPDKKRDRASHVNFSFDKGAALLGDRWTLSILGQFSLRSSLSYTELLVAVRGIATNILSNRLRKLVCEGVLVVAPSKSDGRKLLYSLTAKGSDLGPVSPPSSYGARAISVSNKMDRTGLFYPQKN